jgi:transposase
VYDAYAETGRPSIDPVVFFKLQLILFFEGLRSERQLLRVVHDRLSLRWYLGYDLGEALSDHSSLTRIQERYGLEVFRRFKAVVEQCVAEQCVAAGLVWGHEVFIDATKIAVNAALDSLHPRFAVEAISRASSPRRRMTATMAREAVQPGKVATNRRCCQSP